MFSVNSASRAILSATAAFALATLPLSATRVSSQVPSRATISVDCAIPLGPRFPVERFNNLDGPSLYASQRSADVAFLNEQGLHGAVYRVWMDDIWYDESTGKLEEHIAPYLSDASKLSDAILMSIELPRAMGAHQTPEQIKPMLKRMIGDLKKRYPQIKYIEALNEPDWGLAKVLKPEELYKYYAPFYEAVNEVNAELKPASPLLIGGPAVAEFDSPWLGAFLDSYKADPSPQKRLDFISYHGYGHFNKPGDLKAGYHFFKFDPTELSTQRSRLDQMLASRGLDTNTPSFITELGLYPGPSFDNLSGHSDALRQAAGMATFGYWFTQNPKNVPFNWVLRHHSEERKDQMVTRVGNGEPVPTRTFTPYGNEMAMMAKQKANRISAVSDAIDHGKGVYAVGSLDGSGLSILVWNYQLTGTAVFDVTLRVAHLPRKLRKNYTKRIYRIDEHTSNYYFDPVKSNLQMISESAGRSRTAQLDEKISLTPNALELITFEPVATTSDRIKK
jgi:hypothetical protein